MDQMEHFGTDSKPSLMDSAMVGGQPVDLRSDIQPQGQPASSGSFIVVNSGGVLSAGVGGGGVSSLGRPGTGAMSPANQLQLPPSQLQPPPRSASSVVTGGGRMTAAVVGRPAGSPAAVTRLFIPSNQMRSLSSVVGSGVGGGAQPLRVVATAPVSSSVATSISFQPHQQFVGSPPVGRFRMVAPATSGIASPGRSIIVGAQSQRLSLLSSPRKILATGEIPRLSSSPHRIVIRPSATIGPNKILRVVGATTASPGRSLLAPLPKSSGAASGSHLQHQLGVPLHTVVASSSSAPLTVSSAPSPGAIKTLQRRLLPGASFNYPSAATATSIGLEAASARPLGDPSVLPLSAPTSSMAVLPGVSRSGSVGVASRARSNDLSVTDILRTATKYAVQVAKENPQPEVPGLRPRKPCNCTKSQCLKLYCDCFAAGEFCNNCNCTNCYNSLQHEEDRQRAVRQCLDRNPQAFKPKIGKSDNETRKHQKGCHCKKSGCLKNYCECYEAKIFCSSQCKCVGCRNCESTRSAGPRSMAVSTLLDDRISAVAGSSGSAGMRRDAFLDDSMMPGGDQPFGHLQLMSSVFGPQRQQSIRVTQSVIDAALMCLMAESCQPLDTERRILMEFGRCLSQIIDYGTRRPGSSTSSTEPGRV